MVSTLTSGAGMMGGGVTGRTVVVVVGGTVVVVGVVVVVVVGGTVVVVGVVVVVGGTVVAARARSWSDASAPAGAAPAMEANTLATARPMVSKPVTT